MAATTKTTNAEDTSKEASVHILGHELLERFAYYGFRSILIIFLVDAILLPIEQSQFVSYSFNVLLYFTPVLGAILGDCIWGKFTTVFNLAVMGVSGYGLVLYAAQDPTNGLPFTLIGLLLISLGIGGMKPCVVALAGENAPEERDTFFSWFYAGINISSIAASFIVPFLRNQENGYVLAFGAVASAMLLSTIVFALGKPSYKQTNKEIKKYTKEDIAQLLRLGILLSPLPIFWMLFNHFSAYLTTLALATNPSIGGDHLLSISKLNLLNPILVILLIPIANHFIYPAISFLNTSLKKLIVGGLLMAVAFGMAAMVWRAIEAKAPTLPSVGQAHVNYYNFADDMLLINGDDSSETFVGRMNYAQLTTADINGEKAITFTDKHTGSELVLHFKEGQTLGYYIRDGELVQFLDSREKNEFGYALVTTIINSSVDKQSVSYFNLDGSTYPVFDLDKAITLAQHDYQLVVNTTTYPVPVMAFESGGVYRVMIEILPDGLDFSMVTTTSANSVSIVWVLPLIATVSLAEVMFSITGLIFCYTEAPLGMRSLAQALWLFSLAIGNVLSLILQTIPPLEHDSCNMALYTIIMLIDMLIFTRLAQNYQKQQRKVTKTN